MSKNKHNQTVGSTVERDNERIDSTGEVFTPAELCQQMVSEIPQSVLQNKNSTFSKISKIGTPQNPSPPL